MKIETFWEQYANDHPVNIFDITYEFFSQELPEDIEEEYNLGDVILETVDHQIDQKNHENALKFIALLEFYNPDLYLEYFQYIDEFLVDYYCFHRKYDKVHQSFTNFSTYPLQDFDKYLEVLKKLMFYQHTKILKDAIHKNFEMIDNSADLMQGASYELAVFMIYEYWEQIYKNTQEKFDKKQFSSQLAKYNFDLTDDYLTAVEQGVSLPVKDTNTLKSMWVENANIVKVTLQGYFCRYMYEKDFPFYLSAIIWDEMIELWEEFSPFDESDISSYFQIKYDDFEEYLSRFFFGYIYEKSQEMVGYLWGSVYVYDFLYKFNLISKEDYDSFISISKIFKGTIIAKFFNKLWSFNFVHLWLKPDSISQDEFEAEQKIFRKSITYSAFRDDDQIKNDLSEELSEIGDLSQHIIEGFKTENRLKEVSLPDVFPFDLDENINTKKSGFNSIFSDTEPIIKDKKPGRNDPCPCGSGKKYKKCCGMN
ncbi:MAG: SEC-C metal-binding domain-containing protein [Bacteroidales bacterium]